jgi:PAS domain S-box-containing protein
MGWQGIKNALPRFFLILGFCLLAMSGSYFIISESRKSIIAVSHTYEVIASLETMISQMKDAETGQRGYLLTGDATYLRPFNEAVSILQATIEKCRTLLRDNPRQLRRLDEIQNDASRKVVELQVGISRRDAHGLDSALQVVKSGIGEKLMNHMRVVTSTMEDDERQLLDTWQVKRNRYLSLAAIFVGLLVALFLASFITLLIQIQFRQRAQEKVGVAMKGWRSSEQRFRLLIEGVKDYALYWLDPEGRVSSWTQAAERIKGYKEEEILGSHFSRFYPPEAVTAGVPDEFLRRALADGYAESTGWHIKKDGTPFWAHSILTPIKDDRGNLLGYSKLVRDTTKQKQSEDLLEQKEQELAQSRKLEAIGRLAGGIAHDFNNLMTGIIGVCEELEEDPTMTSQLSNIQEISEAAKRATLLTKQLLAFSRRQIAAPIVLNINQLISDMQKMLRRLIGEDVEFFTHLDPQLGLVRVDPGQIEQILINLAINSRDALPKGGKITIETMNVELTEDYVKRHFEAKPGSYVALTFSDNGTGIPLTIQSHIFEPFFTTKAKGKGTGLGLATVYGIVKQNGGDIFLYSRPGEGTTFRIYLPCVSEDIKATETLVMPTVVRGGTETVLLVEDENLVRRVAKKALTKQGYQVIEARRGDEALDLASQFTGAIDLLLTDVVMPGLNGQELADRLVALRPGLKVLYMSGYTEDIIVNRGMLKPGISFIEKSFTAASLCTKVRTVLDAPALIS